MSALIKINFKLQPDADGYPPAAVETLWANPVGSNFEIDSIPFFTCDATVGDLVQAVPDSAGSLWFKDIAHRSQRSLIRVVFFDVGCQKTIASKLKDLGCDTEGMELFKLLAVDVPPEVDIREIQAYLNAKSTAGLVDYEEALIRH